MIDGQYNIFDMLYPKKKITKPIKMITLFSGYDSQCLAMNYLGVKYEHWKTCEWAVKSIQALKDIHFDNDNNDYSKGIEIGKIKEFLFNKGISQNYNEPMTKQQVDRLNEYQARTIYNNIQATHNLVNIQQVKGEDLEIKDTDKYEYIMTYSFPCQDISGAGKGAGFTDKSTRSGMLWEVERILQECKDLGTLPQILLMENVPLIHSVDNLEDFNKWKLRLEELGYKNYFQDLIATDYGIPQTRNRCFMISLLGDYNYTFPKPIPLKLKLKDMLESNVDEKYYISDKLLKYYDKKIEQGWRKELHTSEDVAMTICNPGRNQINDNFIKIKNATSKGYLEATEGDGIDISSRMEYHIGTVQKGKSQTLTTSGGNDRGVVCLGGYGKIGSTGQYYLQNRVYDDKIATSITTSFNPYYKNDLRIRKLTPRECGRLMNVKDEDIDKILKNQSDSSAFHLFGDSICTNVLMAIFGELLDINWKEKLEEMI